MAISQHRVIALINAALDYMQALHHQSKAISEAARRAAAGIGDPRDHLLDLSSYSPNTLLNEPSQSFAAITTEYNHFRRNAKRNDTEAKRMARKRASDGAIMRATTPRTSHLDRPTIPLPNALEYRMPALHLPSAESRTSLDAETDRLLQTKRFLESVCPHPSWILDTERNLQICTRCGTAQPQSALDDATDKELETELFQPDNRNNR
jgi:hypothetical protein